MEKVILSCVGLISFYLVALASAQAQQQVLVSTNSELSNQKNEASYKNQEPGGGNHVSGLFSAYRTGTAGSGIVATSGGNTQGYTYTGYSQDPSYGSSSPPIFGITSTGDFNLAAQFGPIFWGIVVAALFIALVVFAFRFVGGFEKIGGYVKNLGEKSASGKSLDLDKLTDMAYQAFDKYEKWNSKRSIS